MLYRVMVVFWVAFLVGSPAALTADTSESGKPSIDVANTAEVSATVAEIDKEKRTVVLKGAEGEEVTIHVQDDVDLDQVDVGDKVVARYREAVAIRVTKAGEVAPGAVSHESVTAPKPGEKPSRDMVTQTVVTATVAEINREAHEVTLRGPGGNERTLHVQDPQNLENVEVGDNVTVVYTEALAISVEEQSE